MRLPIRQPVRLPVRQSVDGAAPEQRYFRTNSGTTDYVQLDSIITLSGDFTVEWIGQWPQNAAGGHFFCRYSSDSGSDPAYRLLVFNGNRIYGFGVNNATMGITYGDSLMHAFSISRSGSNVTLSVDGNIVASWGYSSDIYIGNLMLKLAASSIPSHAGIMSSLKITQSGVITHSWAISDNSNTIVDSVGGNDGTIINGDPGDWELYTRVGDTWVGTVSGEVIEIAY